MDVAKLKQMVDELGELLKRSNAQYEEMRRIVDGEAGEVETPSNVSTAYDKPGNLEL